MNSSIIDDILIYLIIIHIILRYCCIHIHFLYLGSDNRCSDHFASRHQSIIKIYLTLAPIATKIYIV
jgi:hypothetical protein